MTRDARRATGALLLALAMGLAFVAWARLGVDHAALVQAHDQRMLAGRPENDVNVEQLSVKLARFHQGPPPCAYGPARQVSTEELELIERDLRGARMLSRVRALSSLFYEWGQADEARRHGPRSDDEAQVAWSETGSVYERAVAAAAGHDVAQAIRAANERRNARLLERADLQKKTLSEHELESLYGVWMRHPVALSFPALAQTMSRLPAE